MPPVDASRGTALWGINRLRSDGFVALLNDLASLERPGLDEPRCQQVQAALARLTNAATAIPDSSWWKRQIWQELQAFETIYIQWNAIEGSADSHVDERRKKLRALRKKRNRIATKIRKNQYVLHNELDLALVNDSYRAFGELAKSLPEVFKNLAGAVGRFTRKSREDTKGH